MYLQGNDINNFLKMHPYFHCLLLFLKKRTIIKITASGINHIPQPMPQPQELLFIVSLLFNSYYKNSTNLNSIWDTLLHFHFTIIHTFIFFHLNQIHSAFRAFSGGCRFYFWVHRTCIGCLL